MRRFVVRLSVSVALTWLLVAAGVATASPTASQGGSTLRVTAGLGEGVVSINQFAGDPALPGGNTVRVAEGATVAWTLGSTEFHTVTFRAGAPWPPVIMQQPEDPSRPPMFNPQIVFPTIPSGPWDGNTFIHMELQSPGQELRVTFGRQGRYPYSCLFHEEMDGFVEVVPPGSPGITTQAAVDQFAATHQAEQSANAAKMLADRSVPSRVEGPGGASIWFVRAGTNERRGHIDLEAFLPDALTVSQGDTVVWYVDHVAPHTVTFPGTDGLHPEFLAVQLPDGTMLPAPAPGEEPPPEVLAAFMDPTASPRLVFVGGVPSGPGPVHDGRSTYNSGFIGEHPLVDFPMQKTWALTFGTPGVYHYDCLLHEMDGMAGTITVVAR